MHTLQAIQSGSLAAQAVKLYENSILGHVIVAFPNSFYVKTLDNQLLFITNRSLHSPITINVAGATNFTYLLEPTEPVYLRQARLSSSRLSIEFTDVGKEKKKILLEKIESPHYLKLLEDSALMSTILNVIENTGSVLDPKQHMIHDPICDFINYGVIPLRAKWSPSNFAKAAENIVGLGLGFTPSGDDFLLGFLVIYNSLSPAIGRPPIHLEFDQVAERTSWISAKLLDYAQHLQIDDQLLHLVQSTSSTLDTVTALETLIPRGHTSGIDIVVGAVLGLSIVCDIALGQSDTESVAAKLGFQ